ncbi:hypothetical protein AGR1C_pAt20134 [Agrobacterium fabacearum TT111]|nr:hypothetical protein AGR1C_pAt20134 [Agrobacterium fabacearum TT111]
MELTRRIGAAIVHHSGSNSDAMAGRDPDDELAYLRSVQTHIAQAQGSRAAGWSSPGLAYPISRP